MRVHRLVEAALDLVYPPKCALCDTLGARGLCSICRDAMAPHPEPVRVDTRPGEIATLACTYLYEGQAAEAIQLLKYGRITSLRDPLSDLIHAFLIEHSFFGADLVVPVPIHWRRKCWRGFNQAEYLCRSLPPSMVNPYVLKRVRATRPQVGLNHDQRLRNLQGAFWASTEVNGKHLLLLDDVITSGQTMRESAKVLYGAGAASVSAVALAGA